MSATAPDRRSCEFTWYFSEYQLSPTNNAAKNRQKTVVLIVLAVCVYVATFVYFFTSITHRDYIVANAEESQLRNVSGPAQCTGLSRFSNGYQTYGFDAYRMVLQLYNEQVASEYACERRIISVIKDSCLMQSTNRGTRYLLDVKCSAMTGSLQPLHSFACFGDTFITTDRVTRYVGNASEAVHFATALSSALNDSGMSQRCLESFIESYNTSELPFMFEYSQGVDFIPDAEDASTAMLAPVLRWYEQNTSPAATFIGRLSVGNHSRVCPALPAPYVTRAVLDLLQPPPSVFYLFDDALASYNSSLSAGFAKEFCSTVRDAISPFHCTDDARTYTLITAIILAFSATGSSIPVLVRLITASYNMSCCAGKTRDDSQLDQDGDDRIGFYQTPQEESQSGL